MRSILRLVFVFLFTSLAYGQYYGERVLEQSFETTDFFFQPAFLNPYGMNGFGTATPGLIDDPLLNIQVNPASIALASGPDHYASIIFRNTQDLRETGWYSQPWDSRSSSMSELSRFPYYYSQTRQRAEPVLSGAAMFRPLGRQTPGLVLGATYEMILQDEAYYDIPYDVYRSSLEYDFAGNRTVEADGIPIVDRYQGEDEMHVEGHFISLLSGFTIGQNLSVGVRIGRVLFDREGSYGSQNYWRDNQFEGTKSYWQYLKGRSQNYDHWDFSTGLLFQITPNWTAGVSAGYLWGNVSQNLSRADSSIYRYGFVNQTTDWSLYDRWGKDAQSWFHDGHNAYGGFNLKFTAPSGHLLNLYYRGFLEDVTLENQSAVFDTSSSDYQHVYNTNTYASRSNSMLTDLRSGEGKREGRLHHFAATFEWKIDERSHLHIGGHYRTLRKNTTTVELIFGDRFSEYAWSNTTGANQYDYSVEEQKSLYWDFEVHKTSLQIPILFRTRVANPIELLFGVNRSMERWKITDVTTAIFDYRTITENGQSIKEENFGERYTMPEEKRSDVRTSIIGGLTLFPSDRIHIRLMVVPNYIKTYDGTRIQDLQWWIDLNLFP